MANIDLRTREGRAMKAAAEAARQAASAGKVLNEVAAKQESQVESFNPEQDHRVEPSGFEPEIPNLKRGNPVRDQAFAEIAKARGEPQDEPAVTPEPETSKVESEPATVLEPSNVNPTPAPETPVVVTPEPPKTVKVKVDGVEFDAPASEVEEVGGVRAYQLMKANENRLAKTNEVLQQTRQLQAQLAKMAEAALPKPATVTDAEFIQEKMDVIRFGNPQESAAAMQEVLARNRPNLDQNQIVTRAITAMQQQAAEQAFVSEFQDVVTNPLLLKLTIQLKNERLSQLKHIPDWPMFYRSIGNEIRGAIGRQSQPATLQQNAPAGAPSQPDKEARKASIVNLPTAAARAALPEATKPETREDILNEMRKKRGLPTG